MRTVWLPGLIATGCGLTPTIGIPTSSDSGHGTTTTSPTATDTATTELPPIDCQPLESSECANDARCSPILAQRLQQVQNGYCHDSAIALEHVGCRAKALDCGYAQSFALDSADTPWWLPNLCMPDDWQRITDANPPDC